jgi:protease-4
VVGWRVATSETKSVPKHAVLVLDLRHGVGERRSTSFFSELDDKIVLHDAVRAMAAAAKDSRVTALVARLGGDPISFAHAQELRAAVREFAQSGKPTYAFAESFSETGDPSADYLLATGFNEIWMQPSGDLGALGIMIEQPYLHNLLNKLGVQPQLDQRREYKGGINIFTDTGMPEPQRQNLQKLTDSVVAQLAEGIAEGRKIPPDDARRLIDTGPHSPDEAKSAKLIDQISYWTDLMDKLDPEGKRAYDIADYAGQLPSPGDHAAEVALIVASGMIVGGTSNPLVGEEVTAADDIGEAIHDAADDEDVAAIILRIDSPGGSYVASDTIWREIVRAKEKKPVVVSMSGVAASGGYFIAAPANAILADGATITGSVGVYAGKFVLSGLWDKLGINWSRVQSGANAGLWTSNAPFTPEQWQKFQQQLDRVYGDFIGKVAQGRKLDTAKVEAAAGGRIWTGQDAVNAGLVDRVGGLTDAGADGAQFGRAGEGSRDRLGPLPRRTQPPRTLGRAALRHRCRRE